MNIRELSEALDAYGDHILVEVAIEDEHTTIWTDFDVDTRRADGETRVQIVASQGDGKRLQ